MHGPILQPAVWGHRSSIKGGIVGHRIQFSCFLLSIIVMLASCEGSTVSPLVPAELPSPTNNVTQATIIPNPITQLEEPPPPMAWTAPHQESIDCGNQQIPFTFAPTNRDYSLTNAFWMMWFAKRSFSGEQQATQQELDELGYDRYNFIVNETSGLEVLIIAKEDALIIAFQGSKQLPDWLANFTFFQANGQDHDLMGKIHQGFATMLESEWITIEQTIEEFHTNDQPIWITGHSLGGALGTLTAAKLASEGYPIAPLYTFAAPRVGNTEFAEELFTLLGQRHFRFVNEEDIVARLPPAGAAADEAAAMLPSGIQNWTMEMLRDLDYAHGGAMYRIEINNDLTDFPPLEENEDADYWARTNVGSIAEMLINPVQEVRHNENTYLCKMREVWERSP